MKNTLERKGAENFKKKEILAYHLKKATLFSIDLKQPFIGMFVKRLIWITFKILHEVR